MESWTTVRRRWATQDAESRVWDAAINYLGACPQFLNGAEEPDDYESPLSVIHFAMGFGFVPDRVDAAIAGIRQQHVTIRFRDTPAAELTPVEVVPVPPVWKLDWPWTQSTRKEQ